MVLPVKLSGHTMTPAGQIRPISMSQSWRTDGLSSCTITMRIDDEIQLALGDWALITSPHGHMSGVFYVKNIKTNYVTQQITITLEHTFGLLQEVVVFGEITPETIGGTGVTTTNINTAMIRLNKRQALRSFLFLTCPSTKRGTTNHSTIANTIYSIIVV